MAKFVDINSLTEKVNPDGDEQIQVSDTQKFIWKNALMNSGGFIGAILSYATQYAMGNTTDRQTIIQCWGSCSTIPVPEPMAFFGSSAGR